jgi:hypothetical protein
MGNYSIFRCGRNSEAGTAQRVDQKRNPSFTCHLRRKSDQAEYVCYIVAYNYFYVMSIVIRHYFQYVTLWYINLIIKKRGTLLPSDLIADTLTVLYHCHTS